MRLRSFFYIVFIMLISVTALMAAKPSVGAQTPQPPLNPNLALNARDDILNSLEARILAIKRDMLPAATPNPSYELAAAQDKLLRDYFAYADKAQTDTMAAARSDLDGTLAEKLAANTFNPVPVVESERARIVQTYAQKYEEGMSSFLAGRMGEMEKLESGQSANIKPGSDTFPLGLVALCGLILIVGLALALPGLVLGKVPQNRLRWLQGSLGVINLGIIMVGYGLAALVIIAAVLGGLPNLAWYLGALVAALFLLLAARIVVSLIRSQHPEERPSEGYGRTFSRDRERERRERPPFVPEKSHHREFPRSKPRFEKPVSEPVTTPAPATPPPPAPATAASSSSKPKPRSKPLPRPAPQSKPPVSSGRRDTRQRSQKINLEGMDEDQSATTRIVEALTPPPGFESELDRLTNTGEIPRSRDRGTVTPPTPLPTAPPPVADEAPVEIKPRRGRKPRKKVVAEAESTVGTEIPPQPAPEVKTEAENEDFARIFGRSANPIVDTAPVSQRPGRKRKKSFRR
jgi:hypothetical protein